MPNQNPEQIARDNIDKQLTACGWIIQNKSTLNLSAGVGIAVREYLTDVGPADYVLFVDGKPCEKSFPCEWRHCPYRNRTHVGRVKILRRSR